MPCCNTAKHKRLQRVLCRPCSLYHLRYKTAHRALQGLFLRFVPFYCRRHKADTSGYNTTCTTLERITATQHRSPQPPYYNKVYIRVQHIADRASPAGSAPVMCGSLASADTLSAVQTRRTGWHPPPGGTVQQQERGGRRGTIGGSRRISFRAFAR